MATLGLIGVWVKLKLLIRTNGGTKFGKQATIDQRKDLKIKTNKIPIATIDCQKPKISSLDMSAFNWCAVIPIPEILYLKLGKYLLIR